VINRHAFQLFHIQPLLIAVAGAFLLVSPVAAQFDGSPPGDWGQGDFGGGLFAPAGQASAVVTVMGQFSKATGEKPARLFITAKMAQGWHIYSITQKEGGPIRTTIKLDPSPRYEKTGEFRAIQPPDVKQDEFFPVPSETHHGTVTWYAPIKLADGVDPATLVITGKINAQACEKSCIRPTDYPMTAMLGPGMEVPEPTKPESAANNEAPKTADSIDASELAVTLGLALLGGLLLNLMPCVLPVISLKLLSFLEQAGESRSRVLVLNLWYVVGLMSVFLLLAGLNAYFGYSWGEQFTLPWFKVALTALVFAMALSFLGVWEIPIPGFVGSGRAGQLQSREGADGAFFKGVFTTVMATPCAGPFLGPLFGFLLGKPLYLIFGVYGAIGLGMASPYLLIGIFPGLLRALPKPGAWMETLKQLMAFFLLGTVVYLFTTMSTKYFIPTLSLLVGLWLACWWIGRTPLTASQAKRTTAWLGGTTVAALIGLLAFTVLLYESKMPWQPFSPAALDGARSDGKTVMVDFTADWCPTCKWNLKMAVDTPKVRQLVDANSVVPMLADWTDESPMIKQTLNRLGRDSIPVLAIYPAQPVDGKEVIILSDLISERQVLDALKAAGPSKPTPAGL